MRGLIALRTSGGAKRASSLVSCIAKVIMHLSRRIAANSSIALFSFLFCLGANADYQTPWKTFQPDPARRIHRIALLDPMDLSRFLVLDASGASALFGPLGGAIKGDRLSALSEKLKGEMTRQNVRLAVALTDALERDLRAAGYEVVRVARRRGTPATEGRRPVPPDYSDVPADVLLSVASSAQGFKSSAQLATDYLPFAGVVASMESKDDDQPLMLSGYAYCTSFLKDAAYAVVPCADGTVPLKSDDELQAAMANGEVARSLLAAAPAISTAIVAQLGKAP